MGSRFSQIANAALRVPFTWMALGAIFGILGTDQHWFWGLGALFAAMVLFQKKRIAWLAMIAVLGSAVAFAALHGQRLKRIESFPLKQSLTERKRLAVAGQGTIKEELSRLGQSEYESVLEVRSLSVRDVEIPLPNPVRLICRIEHDTADQLEYGSEVTFTGSLSRIEKAASPGAFDPSVYYFRCSSALAKLRISSGERCVITGRDGGSGLVRLAIRSRLWMEQALLRGVAEKDQNLAGVILAMVLGAREKSPDDLEDLFRLSGTMHIFAVSGLHVGVVAAFLWFLLKWLGLPQRRAVLIIIPAVLFYALLTGLRPSSFRAAIMLSVFLAGFALLRPPNPVNAIGLACLILLACDSQRLFLPGFQLSFCVVLTLVLTVPFLSSWLRRPFEVDPFLPRKRVPPWRRASDDLVRLLAGMIAVSCASWVGSLALMTSHFQGISPVGLIANVFMVPLAGVIIVTAAVSIGLSILKLGFLAAILNHFNLGVAAFLAMEAQFFAGFPGAYIHTGRGPDKSTQRREIMTLEAMGLRGETSVLARDRDHTWLIDTGGKLTFRRQVLPLLRENGINRIDCLVLTHGDSGHIGSAPYILTHLKTGLLLESSFPNRARIYPEIREVAASRNVERLAVNAGQLVRWSDKTSWRVLYPGTNDPPTGVADDRCLVLKIQSGPWRVLHTADIGLQVENRLVNEGWNLKSDVWIRGQHTATPSGSAAFVEKISPRVIISTHAAFPPHEKLDPGWIKKMEDRGAGVMTFQEVGSVRIVIFEDLLIVEPFLKRDPVKITR